MTNMSSEHTSVFFQISGVAFSSLSVYAIAYSVILILDLEMQTNVSPKPIQL